MKKVFVFDVARCSGCLCCQISCKDEHCDNTWMPYAQSQPDTGQFWIRIQDTIRGQVPKVMISYVAHMCQHCDSPACSQACDQDAFDRRNDGLLLLNPDKCNGCMACVEACAYGAVFPNEELQIAQKCTGCAHLLDNGWMVPRCVDACSHQALRFGEETAFMDEIAQSEALLAERADGPHVHYLNLPKRFVGGIVVDLEEDEVLIGARITLENTQSGELLVTESDDFGDFWFKQISASEYRLYVEYEGYLTRVLEVSTQSEDRNVGPIALYAAQQALA